MELSGKRVVVVGLGRSGLSAARLLVARGARVVGMDVRPEAELRAALPGLDVELRGGGHDGATLRGAELVVVSPGVPAFPELAEAERAGVPVIGELDLAARFVTAPIVAIGGTNGKSTVTTATAALLQAAGRRVFAGGNLGTPLAEAIGGDHDVLVVETSSFQLERAPAFHPRVAVLLNVTEDHLDRYASFDEYARAKGNAFVNQGSGDHAVANAADPVTLREARRGAGRLVTFGPSADYEVGEAAVTERESGERFELSGTAFVGAHNHANAAAAIASARALGCPADRVREGLRAFVPLGHRMALVAAVDGVRYYDDSKATNVGAAVTALLGLPERRAVLIAGGRDKLGDYAPLVDALRRRGRAVVLIGEAAARIEGAVAGAVPVRRAGTLEQAVREARGLAETGDAVLLAPACSSFDMFSSYAERGDRFAAAVRGLAAGGGES